MKKHIDTLLAELVSHRNAAPATSVPSNTGLPADIRTAALRGWRIFIVPTMSRYASTAAIVEHIGQATSDLALLEEEFAANANNTYRFGLITGEESGVFAVEVDPSYGGLASCINDSVRGTVDEDYRWRTLASTAGGSLVAFFEFDPVWSNLPVAPRIAPGVRLYADNDWVLIGPFLDPEIPVREPPQLLIELAFDRPPKNPAPAAPRIPSQPAKPTSRLGSAPGPEAVRLNIPRKGFPAFSVGAVRGKFHSSRRY